MAARLDSSVASCCVVCGEPSKSKCANCHNAFYCSREHQKKDWKTHRLRCVAFKVVENEELGRHLVAIRAVSPGEVVLQEPPVVSGPLQTTPPVCLGCYKLLSDLSSRDCSRCGWPVCSAACEKSPAHQAECDITAKHKESKVKIQTFGMPHPSYQCLTVLRCLYLKKNSPELWDSLGKLQSHCEERKHTAKYEADRRSTAQFIPRFFNFTESDEDEIMRVAGIVEVNAHEVPLADPGYVSIYRMASFLEHSCHANCSKSFTAAGDLVVRAAVPIPQGQHLSICYTDPLWGTASRRHHLQETKFFACRCARCLDPTELGTHFSSLVCPSKDCGGCMVTTSTTTNNNNNNNEEPHWVCLECGKTTGAPDVLSMLEKIGQKLASLKKNSLAACKAFITEHQRVLHPHHYFLTDVKLALVQLCGDGGLGSVTDEDLALKKRLCAELYHLTTALVPAENRVRGVLLFEMHSVVAEEGRRQSCRGDLDPAGLRNNLLDCKKTLLQAYSLLSYESEVLPEGMMALQAKKNVMELDKVLRNLEASVENVPVL